MVSHPPRCLLICLIWIALGGAISGQGESSAIVAGGIRGSVYDRDFADPLANVIVTVQEAALTTLSSPEGKFLFPNVPAGTYTVSFAKDGYQRRVIGEVMVRGGELTEVTAELSSEVAELDELVVTAGDLLGGAEAQLLEIRQEAPALTDSISRDLIAQAGASTAAGALRLVVGTSVQDDKYVVIRGLSDRYTGTLLNQVRVPSADPDKRAVQLDLFPAGTIEEITVYKTFTPDLQGDFTGGGVDIRTRSFPDKLTLSVGFSAEYNSQATTAENFRTYKGGGVSPTGLDGGKRDLPAGVSKKSVPTYQGASANPVVAAERFANAVQLDRQTHAFEPVMGSKVGGAPGPNYSWAASAGNTFELGEEDRRLGVFGGITYRQKYGFYDDGVEKRVSIPGPNANPLLEGESRESKSSDEVLWSALLSLAFQPATNQLVGFNLIYNKNSKDEVVFQTDRTTAQEVEQNQALHYTERTLSSLQLRGDHRLPPLFGARVDWLAAYSVSRQEEPDVRFFRNLNNPQANSSSFSGTPLGSTLRVWRDIEEQDQQVQLNLKVPFRQWTDTEGFVKLGPFYDFTERQFKQNSFTYLFPNQAGPLFNPARLANASLTSYTGKGLWSRVFAQRDRTGLARNFPPANNQLLWYIQPSGVDVDYHGEQVIQAFYGMAELPLTPRIKLIGGARLEWTELTIDLKTPTGNVLIARRLPTGDYNLESVPVAQANSSIDQVDLLPAAGLVVEPLDKVFLKANWSQTIARPTFRELAPVVTYELLGDDAFTGNPSLALSQIDNYDLRLEWFRRPGEVYAASVFYKEITDPIEQISFSVSGNRYVQKVNYPEGHLFGIELEGRQKLDVLDKLLGIESPLQDLTVGLNGAWIQSRVTVPTDEYQQLSSYGLASKERRMAGQPDYLFNANVTYENPRRGTTASLFYNWTGKVLETGAGFGNGNGIPTVMHDPVGTLNLNFEQKVGKHWKFRLSLKNLNDPMYREFSKVPSGKNPTYSKYHKGVDIALGGSCSW